MDRSPTTASLRSHYLEAMGITSWRSRTTGGVGSSRPSIPARPEAAREVEPGRAAALHELRAAVASCTQCDLHRARTKTVFGTGEVGARCMVIGEAPGAEEDRQGEPFVGRAGRLLNAMLQAIGLSRAEVYIANIVKCRPPKNRDPRPEEAACCARYLRRQIELVAPEVIVAAGRVAAQNLLGSTLPVGRLRGTRHGYGDRAVPVIVTYHPAYLLRSPQEKAKAWEDLKRVRAALELQR